MEHRARILIVDDNVDSVELLAHCLKEGGYEVERAYDGKTAIEKAQSGNIDLVLLDVVMPEIDGHEVCRTLKSAEQTSHVPVIFVTVKDSPEDETEGFKLGASDYITKPYSMRHILSRVNAAVHTKQLQEELRKRNAQLSDPAYTDGLTGLRNRRYFVERFREEVEKARRYRQPVSCLFLQPTNVDKAANDHGAEIADDMLVEIAFCLNNHSRSFDIVSRFAESRFAMALPLCGFSDANRYANKIHTEIEERSLITPRSLLGIDVSMGLASCGPEVPCDADGLMEHAQAKLYEAMVGGNRGVVSVDLSTVA